MRIRAYLPGRAPYTAEIDGTDFRALQEFVGGYIEAVAIPLGLWLICNEEGKLLGLPANRRIPNGDIVVGPFFVCRAQGENFSDLPEEDDELADSLFS